MRTLISKYGQLDWQWESDYFDDLISSIISQQLSTKAADTIYKRFVKVVKVSPPTPSAILSADKETLRAAGLSYSKISYIQGIADAVKSGEVKTKELDNLADEEVMKTLTALKGVGTWTAEMFLMFSLKRPDVFSVGDMGLKNAISNLYKIDKNDTESILKLSQTWSPFRTYASRYLWKSLENK